MYIHGGPFLFHLCEGRENDKMLSSLYRRYLGLSILHKLMLWVMLSVGISFAVILYISFSFSAHDMRAKARSSTMNLVLYENALVQSEQQYLYGVAAYYATNGEVQAMMRASNAGDDVSGSGLSNDLFKLSLSRMHILSLSFYDINGRALAYRSIDQSYGVMDQSVADVRTPLGDLYSGRYTYLWRYVPRNGGELVTQDNSPKICLWYLVRDNTNYRSIGAICITLDSRKLLRAEYGFDQTYYSHMFILDDEGQLVIERGQSMNFTDEELKLLSAGARGYLKSGEFSVSLRGESYDVLFSRIDETNGYITFAILGDLTYPFDSPLFWGYCLSGLFIVLLLMVPLTLFVSRTLSRPLNRLLRSMSEFKDGHREAHVNLYCDDEIGRLGTMFNEIVAQNNRLIEDTYMLTIRRQAAELTALSVQIDPHFICNTMHMIQWTALESGADELAEMAYCTGQLFHLSLNGGRYFSTMAQEKRLLEYYLLLQQKRFGERVSYELDFAPEVMDVQAPKLLIQPLVENCLVHGVDAEHPRIHIRISAEATGDDRLTIRVEDDGAGIPPEMLAHLPEGVRDSGTRSGNGYALKNISDRLRLFYGEYNYLYQFHSQPGQGTTVLIEIPRAAPESFLNQNN